MAQQSAFPQSSEMFSLNLDDLDVEELENRLELAAALPTCLRSGDSGCRCHTLCGCNNKG